MVGGPGGGLEHGKQKEFEARCGSEHTSGRISGERGRLRLKIPRLPKEENTGTHRSSILPIHGQDSELTTGQYKLKGIIRVRGDGTGDASILFTLAEGNGRNIQGNFFVLVPGNGDRLWLISSGQTVVNPGKPDNGEPAPELVDLDAVRVAS